MSSVQQTGPSFRILLICTGNIYRSPAAEHLFRQQLPERLGIEISSAGTQARPAQPIAEEIASLLAEAGIDARAFRSGFLLERDVREADLILGLEHGHRSAAVSRVPTALGRSFTLKEFARLTRTVPDDVITTGARRVHPASRLELLVREAAASRGSFRPHDDDIVDPIGKGDAVIRSVFAQIRACVDTIAARALGPLPLATGGPDLREALA